MHVQQIADRAGLSRTVVYRHFADRADLDRAVQAEIVDALYAELLPEVTLEGTIPQIVERIVATYVGWAVTHPALHRLAEQDSSTSGPGPLQHGIERIALAVAELITTAFDLLEVELGEDERASVDPLVFGLVGAVFSAVRRWMSRPDRVPPAPVIVSLVTDSVWYLLQGHARTLGVPLERDEPIEVLLARSRSTSG